MEPGRAAASGRAGRPRDRQRHAHGRRARAGHPPGRRRARRAGAAHHHPAARRGARNAQAAKQLARRLRRWHGKVADQGLQFAALDIPARHELRKRGKRLRYSLAFAESLLPAAKLRGYRKLLSRVQDILVRSTTWPWPRNTTRRVRPRTRRPGSRWAGSARGWKSWRRKRSRLSTTWRTASRSGSKAGAGPPPHRVADEKRASFAGRPWRFKARSRS